MASRVQKKHSASSDNNGMAHPFRESSRQSDKLERRSCRGCHQRKVRCDRKLPCINCSRCGISCVYPTKDREKGGPSLQNISSRLERLEILLSRFVEHSQVTTGSAADRGHGEPETQTTGAANQHSSSQHRSKSTWEILLNDGQGIRYADNSNIEALLQDVSGFLRIPAYSPI